MKGGGGGTQTSTQQTQLPEWMNDYSQKTLSIADDVTSQPYQSYDGQRVAGFTGDQTQAQQAIRDQQGQTGAALGSLGQQAQGMAGYTPQQVQAGQLSQTNLDPYMNQHLGAVEDYAMQNIDASRRMAGNQIADKALAGGAYGGSRFALQQSANDAAAMQQAGQMSANLRSQAFQQAQQAATGDINRTMQGDMFNSQQGVAGNAQNLQALGMAGNLYQGQQGANYADINALAGSGTAQQGLNQQGLDVNYQAWQQQQQNPLNMLQARAAIGQSIPHGSTTTMSQPTSGSNPAMGALGGAMSGAATGAMFGPWGALAGGVIGGAGGLLASK